MVVEVSGPCLLLPALALLSLLFPSLLFNTAPRLTPLHPVSLHCAGPSHAPKGTVDSKVCQYFSTLTEDEEREAGKKASLQVANSSYTGHLPFMERWLLRLPECRTNE